MARLVHLMTKNQFHVAKCHGPPWENTAREPAAPLTNAPGAGSRQLALALVHRSQRRAFLRLALRLRFYAFSFGHGFRPLGPGGQPQ